MKRYTKMEYENPEEMIFGHAKYPVKSKWGLEIGAGSVIPNIKIAPGEGTENSEKSITAKCANIAKKCSR